MRRGRASKLVLCVVVVGWLMYGRYRTRQGPPNSMNDDPSPAKLGLTDAELAVHPTVFAADALKDRVVVVSGGAGGIGRAIAWLFARLGAHVVAVGRDQGNRACRRHPGAGCGQRAVRYDLGRARPHR